MSKRSDIIDATDVYSKDGRIRKYGLLYTERCGWVDLGHSSPESASGLWSQISAKTVSHAWLAGKPQVQIDYHQSMRSGGIGVGIRHVYLVHKALSVEEQRSIALAIFMNVSIAFEGMQSSWMFRWRTDSGFSAEDLVSNLIGFYRALHPQVDYIAACRPVSRQQAEAIWDTYGAVGKLKNQQFAPLLFPTPASRAARPAWAACRPS
jgi:hypothetical protein